MAKGRGPDLPTRALGAAAFEAVRALVWQTCYMGAVSGERLADELEFAAGGESGEASELLLTLAEIARRAALGPGPIISSPGGPALGDSG